MTMCLYHPEHGYYTKTGNKIGAEGDFFTSCNLTASFGAMIGKQLEEMWRIIGAQHFTIVEYGAGTGQLCRDILAYLQNIPELYQHLRYCIIEISPSMRIEEQKILKDKVGWYSSIEDIEGEIHCVISNELLDNFPVHQVIMQDELMEVYITYDETFKEILKPADTELKSYFDELKVKLPIGFRAEINLQALNWLKMVAAKLNKGFVLTIDYGGLSEELYKKHRSCGTLVCYHKHQINDDLFSNIGEQDITAHVNFSALIHWGYKEGLQNCGITSQCMFLLSLGFKEHLRQSYENQVRDLLQILKEEAYISRTLLLDMGEKYKVIIHSKNISDVKLKGLS